MSDSEVESIFRRTGSGRQRKPNIDLYNFDNAEFADSRYVLTSPRSLEACGKYGIKPVELLYKPLSDFQDDLTPQGVPMRTIFNLYDTHESERLGKLKMCRNERERLVLDEVRGISRRDSPSFSRPHTPETELNYSRRSRFSESEEERPTSQSSRRIRGILKTSRTMSPTNESLSKNRHSLSRSHHRSSSSRHQRHSYADSDDSGYEFDNESLQQRQTAWTTNSARSRSALDKPSKRYMSQSMTDLGISALTSSPRSMTSSVDSARPITNRKLRKKLRAGDSVVSEKDQKILEALVMKHEKQVTDRKDRAKIKHMWEEERLREERDQALRNQQHRREMEEQKTQRQLERMERRHALENREASIKADREAAAQLSRLQWEETSLKQRQLKEFDIQEKKRLENLRKQSQEKMKELYEKENQEYQEFVNHKQQFDLIRANMRKDLSLSEKQWNHKKSNELSKYQHSQRYNQVKKQKKKDLKDLKTSLVLKHKAHENNFGEILDNREYNKQLSQMERQQKQDKTRKAQEIMDRELDHWKNSIKLHREMSETKANLTVESNLDNRRRKVFEDRTRRETSQKLNRKNYEKEKQTWQRDMKGYIALKDAKTQEHQYERDLVTEKSRSIAANSQRLRDEVRRRYDMDTFDKKVHQVKLEARVGAGVYSATKNRSTLKIQ